MLSAKKFITVVLVTGVIVFSLSSPAQVYPVRFEESLGARRVREVHNITSSLQQALVEIGYGEQANEIIVLIKKNFPSLESLCSKSPEARTRALAEMIKQAVRPSEEKIFELPDVFKTPEPKANCYGYAQLFYVMGKTLGLDVELLVCPRHIINLVKLDSGCLIVDVALRQPLAEYYISEVFEWEEGYIQNGVLWFRKDSYLLLDEHSIVQRVTGPNMLAVKYANYGEINMEAKQYGEALKNFLKAGELYPYFYQAFSRATVAALEALKAEQVELDLEEVIKLADRAISLYPDDRYSLCNRATAKVGLGLYQEAVYDYDEVLEIDPLLPRVLFNRGLTRYRFLAGQDEDGIKDIARAISLNRYLQVDSGVDIDDNMYENLDPELKAKVDHLLLLPEYRNLLLPE